MGGDEFYIIVSDCDITRTETVKQRVASIIENHNQNIADPILKLSLSVGYCHGGEMEKSAGAAF